MAKDTHTSRTQKKNLYYLQVQVHAWRKPQQNEMCLPPKSSAADCNARMCNMFLRAFGKVRILQEQQKKWIFVISRENCLAAWWVGGGVEKQFLHQKCLIQHVMTRKKKRISECK